MFQDIVKLLEDQLFPLVQAELSVLVDVLHQPDLLFPAGTEERKKCEGGGFISRQDNVFPFKFMPTAQWVACPFHSKGDLPSIFIFGTFFMKFEYFYSHSSSNSDSRRA